MINVDHGFYRDRSWLIVSSGSGLCSQVPSWFLDANLHESYVYFRLAGLGGIVLGWALVLVKFTNSKAQKSDAKVRVVWIKCFTRVINRTSTAEVSFMSLLQSTMLCFHDFSCVNMPGTLRFHGIAKCRANKRICPADRRDVIGPPGSGLSWRYPFLSVSSRTVQNLPTSRMF